MPAAAGNDGSAVQPKTGMNLHEIMKDYVESMLSEQPGRKALILDRQTLGKINFQLVFNMFIFFLVIVSMIYSRT